ncbi:MAG: glycolate oxidase subunit GlcF [Pseudomonadota bacterium]|jgi:glycolate oxidase iron-sulfur subunit
MQTTLADFIKDTPEGREAEDILRKCVHCGFCTATCPTYQLLGDELDGPRGRIYLIKQMLEGAEVTAKTQLHLDRCLTCRACETTCPSGVEYGRLADIGRQVAQRRVRREPLDRLKRAALKEGLPRGWLFAPALRLGQWFRPLLPKPLATKVPPRQEAGPWPAMRHERRMLVLAGCVQPALAPDINPAAARVLDRLGISLWQAHEAGCCGALPGHLGDPDAARAMARRNIDAWWPHIEHGVEAIVMTASGCGVFVKDYGHLLQHDPAYRDKAARVATLTRDVAEVLAQERDKLLALLSGRPAARSKLAFHSPCTLQHGQKIRGVVEEILTAAGFELTPVAESHLCCGSAGTYSILQPELSAQLRERKLKTLQAGGAPAIVTANIGCLAHLQAGTDTPVSHWVQLLDRRLGP